MTCDYGHHGNRNCRIHVLNRRPGKRSVPALVVIVKVTTCIEGKRSNVIGHGHW